MGLDSYWTRVIVYAIGLHFIQILFSLNVEPVAVQYSASTIVILGAIVFRAVWLLSRNRNSVFQLLGNLYKNTAVLFMFILSITSVLFVVALYYISAPMSIIIFLGLGAAFINSFLALRLFN